MRIACVGGGPAGLYLAILLSQPGTEHEVTVFERHPRGTNPGWGVVFFDGLAEALDARDEVVAREVRESAFHWVGQVIDVADRESVHIPNDGHSIRRATLIDILTRRAGELGVDVRYGEAVTDPDVLGDYDLVVAADGVSSALRTRLAPELGTVVDRRSNRYAWLGTTRVFSSFTFPFVRTPAGWVWAHAYAFDPATSCFIVEMSAQTWEGLGLDHLTTAQASALLEETFSAQLDGHPLLPPPGVREGGLWQQFPHVTNERWHLGNLVLLGDAAHSTHFSIGSGTRLAMGDAMALADALAEPGAQGSPAGLQAALAAYGHRRRGDLEDIQPGALNSARWFEEIPRYIGLRRHGFAIMFERRRTSLHRRMPVRAYLALSGAASAVPVAGSLASALLRRMSALRA